MGLEIERKFLVKWQEWQNIEKPPGVFYKQGYIVNEKDKNIRIRIAGNKAFLTIKGKTSGFSKPEFEYEIPVSEAEQLLSLFTENSIEKIRYKISFDGKIWEVDVFTGENEGLVVAEIELQSETEIFLLPEWAGDEVTEDTRYYNANLINYPYKKWERQD
jgi:CYTH domain-containing protein